jgi:hypothetical protein
MCIFACRICVDPQIAEGLSTEEVTVSLDAIFNQDGVDSQAPGAALAAKPCLGGSTVPVLDI